MIIDYVFELYLLTKLTALCHDKYMMTVMEVYH